MKVRVEAAADMAMEVRQVFYERLGHQGQRSPMTNNLRDANARICCKVVELELEKMYEPKRAGK